MRALLVSPASLRPRRRPLAMAVLAAPLLFGGCSDLFQPAAPTPAAVALSLSLPTAAGTDGAYRQVDQVRLRLTRPGVAALDTVLPFQQEVRITVPLTQPQESAQLLIELRRGSDPLFRDSTSVRLRAGEATEAPLTLHAVPARVSVQAAVPEIRSLGDTLQLGGAVLYATGDTIAELPLSWQALDPAIVEVSTAGLLVSRAEGEARVEGRYGSLADTLRVLVRAVVVSVEVEPDSATLQVGQTLQLAAVLRDARGNALSTRDSQGELISGRAVSWSSSRLSVAQVDEQSGLVSAAAPDTVTVTATTSEGKRGSARLDVRPLAPTVTECLVDVYVEDAWPSCLVHPQQALTSVWFEWGPTANLGNSTDAQSLSGSTAQRVDYLLQPLSPNTTYHWRLIAANAGGTTASEIQSFTTESLPTFTLTITGGGTGSGRVDGPAGIECTITEGEASGTCQAGFASGTEVTLTATPAAGHSFNGWSGACTGTDPQCFLVVEANTSVTASFALVFSVLNAWHWRACALTTAGEAYCWGHNSWGQLGTGDTSDNTTPVPVNTTLRFSELSGGENHTCALTTEGRAYCWGLNSIGQLGTGDPQNSTTPVAVNTNLTFSKLRAGAFHTCALTDVGEAYCWGSNSSGQLGTGDQQDRNSPVAVDTGLRFQELSAGFLHSCAVTTDGEAYCWGNNSSGRLGTGDQQDRNSPAAVDTQLTFSALSAGHSHTCGLAETGQAYCWGRNGIAGVLGTGDISDSDTPVPVNTDLTFSELTAGSLHTCGLAETGQAYCWGLNSSGELGTGDESVRYTPAAVNTPLTYSALRVGSGHTCALADSGQGYCWGNNMFGQLGTGDQLNRNTPVAVRQ